MAGLDGNQGGAAESCNTDSGGAPDPGTSGAPSDARYWVGQSHTGLSAEMNLGALTTGLVKVTVAAGIGTPSTAVAGTDYQAPLADVITAQAYANPDSITVTAKGIVTAITAGSAKALRSITLTAGTGLTGGGDLSANRTFALADTAVSPGSYTYASITVDQQGRLTAASSGTTPVLPTRQVLAGTGLTGGGNLSSDVTISMPNTGPGAGTSGGGGNFIESLTLDAQGRVTALTTAAAGSSGYTTVENNGTPVTQRSTINLSTAFTATDSGSKTVLALATMATSGVLGSANGGTAPAAISTSTNGHVFLRRSGAVGWNLLVDENIDSSAAIALSKLATGTATNLTFFNGSGVLAASGITLASNTLTHAASSTGTVSAVVSNTNTGASANALVHAMVASGGTTADAILQASISGGASVVLAIDNSDSDAAVISLGSTPGTGNVFRALASGGEVSVRTTTNNIVFSISDAAGWSLGFAQDRFIGDTSAMGFLMNAGYAIRANAAGSDNSGNNNLELFGATGAFGSGVKVVMWNNATTEPTSDPSAGGFEFWAAGIRKLHDPTGMVTLLN